MSTVPEDKQQFILECFKYLMFESNIYLSKSGAYSMWAMFKDFSTIIPGQQTHWYDAVTQTDAYRALKNGRPDLAEPINDWYQAIKANVRAHRKQIEEEYNRKKSQEVNDK